MEEQRTSHFLQCILLCESAQEVSLTHVTLSC